MLSGNWKKIQDSPTLIGGFKVRVDDQCFFPTPVLSGGQPFLSSQCGAHWSAFHRSVGAEGCDIVQEVGTFCLWMIIQLMWYCGYDLGSLLQWPVCPSTYFPPSKKLEAFLLSILPVGFRHYAVLPAVIWQDAFKGPMAATSLCSLYTGAKSPFQRRAPSFPALFRTVPLQRQASLCTTCLSAVSLSRSLSLSFLFCHYSCPQSLAFPLHSPLSILFLSIKSLHMSTVCMGCLSHSPWTR